MTFQAIYLKRKENKAIGHYKSLKRLRIPELGGGQEGREILTFCSCWKIIS
jgi:hypothetical protein